MEETKFPFEDFLKDIHAQNYVGSDDDMPDDFDGWLSSLDGEDYINYGDRFGRMLLKLLKDKNK